MCGILAEWFFVALSNFYFPSSVSASSGCTAVVKPAGGNLSSGPSGNIAFQMKCIRKINCKPPPAHHKSVDFRSEGTSSSEEGIIREVAAENVTETSTPGNINRLSYKGYLCFGAAENTGKKYISKAKKGKDPRKVIHK